jgi:hypothetical protein
MLLAALMGLIGIVLATAIAILLIHFDVREKRKRQPEG